MIMKKWLIVCIVFILCVPVMGVAQDDSGYALRVRQYVNQYKDLAMMQQMYSGIPASVILAQAIIETEAGSSELVAGANNHFGIKCKSGWTGPTFSHTDDQPNECFRKYRTVAESYKDHSDYLKNTPRYAPLFKLSATDYAGWAMGLKQCGYATNPIYAQKLIKMIEDYRLQDYTYEVLGGTNNSYATKAKEKPAVLKDSVKPVAVAPNPEVDTFAFNKSKRSADSVKRSPTARVNDSLYKRDSAIIARLSTPPPLRDSSLFKETIASRSLADGLGRKDTLLTDSGKVAASINTTTSGSPIAALESGRQNDEPRVITKNGLKAIYAHKGDMLLAYATKHKIRYAKLLEINELKDEPLEADMYVYLEKKGTSGTHAIHIVQAGETLHGISQAEGIQLKHLLLLNNLQGSEAPAAGAKLLLKQETTSKTVSNQTGATKAFSPSDSLAKAKKTRNAADNYISTTPIASAPPVETSIPATLTTPSGGTTARGTEAVATIPTEVPANTNINTTSATDVPQEKLAHLKSKLDKVVYSGDEYNNEAGTEPQVAAEKKDVPKPTIAKAIAAKTDSSKYYTVKSGDTAYNISHRFNITIKQLNSWNNLDNTEIKIGMKLKVRD